MGTDFNGDGRDDILWLHRQHLTLTNWLGDQDGGFTENYPVLSRPVPAGWVAWATGDFNGDGRDDILWHKSNDTSVDWTNWLGTKAGGFVENQPAFYRQVPLDWFVAGIGDFDSDGRDDILWRHSNGTLTNWLGTQSGGFVENHDDLSVQVPNEWQVAGVGDFDGDGNDDILWRHQNGALTNWLGTDSGSFAGNDDDIFRMVPTDWNVVGIGDFDLDGRDDILWRHANGTLTDWLGASGGGFVENYAVLSVQVSNDWGIAGIGDFNGDGRDDILWRSHDAITNWLGSGEGGFVDNSPAAYANVDFEWFVQPNPSGAGWWDY